MSSSPSPNGQGDPTGEESPEEPPVEEASEEVASEAVVETVECPNCGHVFTGNYCPDCGQEADPSVSATGVIGGFFRELVDVENGFWPTFVGLTLRPGETLQQYLSGVRKGLISPGRYLLAAVVVAVGTRQIGRWIGTEPPPVVDPYMTTADGKREAFGASAVYFSSATEQVPILPFLLIAVPFALSLWTLFRDRFTRGAESLAVGSFLMGHTMLLAEGIDLAFMGADHLSGGPSVELPFLAVIVFMTAYVGIACWECFGPGWKPAAKGVFGVAWAWAEVFATVVVVFAGTAVWLVRAYPGAYYAFDPGETQIWVLLAVAGICSVPLLLHAGVEAYYRYW
jgi:hypothetical protein